MDIRSFVQLTRAEHSVMLVVATLVGEIIALGRLPDTEIMLLSFIPPLFIGLASFAINDFFDVASDKKNKRNDRPLVNGSISPSTAFYLSIVLFFAGVLVSFSLSEECSFIASVFAIFAFLYSYKLKDIPLVGNLYIAGTMAIPFIYGNYAVMSNINPAIIVLVLISFVTGVAREIAGDVRDLEGDKKARRSKTLPMIIGRKNSIKVQSLLYLIAVLLSIFPFVILEPFKGSLGYLFPIIVTDVLILHVAISTLSDHSVKSLRRSRNTTLFALGTGLLGFLLGTIV